MQLHVGRADRERGHADRAVVAAGRAGDRREGDLSGRAAGLSARDRLRAVTAGPHADDVAALSRAVRRLERAARLRIGVVATLRRTRAAATVRVDPQVRARGRRGRWRGLLADEGRAHALRGAQLDHAGRRDHLARAGPPTEPPTRLRLSLQPDDRSVGDARLARLCARNAFGGTDDGAVTDDDHRQGHRLGRSNRRRTAGGGEQTRQYEGSDPPCRSPRYRAFSARREDYSDVADAGLPRRRVRLLRRITTSSSGLRTAGRSLSHPGCLDRPGGRCRGRRPCARSRSRCCRCARDCGRRNRCRAASSPSSFRLSQDWSSAAA